MKGEWAEGAQDSWSCNTGPALVPSAASLLFPPRLSCHAFWQFTHSRIVWKPRIWTKVWLYLDVITCRASSQAGDPWSCVGSPGQEGPGLGFILSCCHPKICLNFEPRTLHFCFVLTPANHAAGSDYALIKNLGHIGHLHPGEELIFHSHYGHK